MRRISARRPATLLLAVGTALGTAVAEESSEQRELALPSTHVQPTRAKYVGRYVLLVDLAGHDLPGARFAAISVLDAEGRELVTPDPDTPPPEASDIEDATISPDGVLVVAATLARGGEPVLAPYDLRRGRALPVVRTGDVQCRAVLADAGGVWCVGLDRAKAAERRDDYDVVYRFSLAGERLASLFALDALPRPAHAWRSSIQIAYGGGVFAAFLPGQGVLLTWGAGGSDPRRRPIDVPLVRLADDPEAKTERVPSELAVLADGTPVLLTWVGRDADEPRRVRRALFAAGPRGGLSRPAGACDLFPPGWSLAGVDDQHLVVLDRANRRLVWRPVRCAGEE